MSRDTEVRSLPWRPRGSAPIAAVLIAVGALAWSGCGDEAQEQAGPTTEVSEEPSAAAAEEVANENGGRPDDEGGRPEQGRKGDEPQRTVGREGQGSQLSPQQVESIRRAIEGRQEGAGERVEEIRQVVEEIRSGERDPRALEELRQSLQSEDRRGPSNELCARLGAPEAICERLQERRGERGEAEEGEEREDG